MNKKVALKAAVVALATVTTAVLGYGYYLVEPNSDGASGKFRAASLQLINVAFSCQRQSDIGTRIYSETDIEDYVDFARAREWLEMSQCETPEKLRILGEIYLMGPEDGQDRIKGMSYLERAASLGEIDAARMLGYLYSWPDYEEYDVAAAARNYERCSEAGDEFCKAHLAELLAYYISPPDYIKAFSYAIDSAKAGISRGQGVVAKLYYSGHGTVQDYEQARIWADKALKDTAAEDKDPYALQTLAYLYLEGRHTPQDTERAIEYLKISAANGNPGASLDLGNIFVEGEFYGITADDAEAVTHYLDAAKAGLPMAESALGMMYYLGIGVGKDVVEGHRWLKKAADVGDTQALAVMGRIYWVGEPELKIKPNYDIALNYLNKAATAGVTLAQADLAYMYSQGIGVIKNDALAFQNAQLAAQAGNTASQALLGGMYYRGAGVTRNLSLAVEWLEKSAAGGDISAMGTMAVLYLEGEGVPADRVRAYMLFNESLRGGYARSALYLGKYHETGAIDLEVNLPLAYALYKYAARNGLLEAERERARLSKQLSRDQVQRTEELFAAIEAEISDEIFYR